MRTPNKFDKQDQYFPKEFFLNRPISLVVITKSIEVSAYRKSMLEKWINLLFDFHMLFNVYKSLIEQI